MSTSKSSFLSPRYEEWPRPDGEGTIKFFPISASLLFRLRGVAAPIVRAVAEAIASDAKDTTIEERSTHRATEGVTGSERVIGAISPELYRERVEQRGKAIDAAVEAIFSEGTRDLLARAIMDSAREESGMGPAAARDGKLVATFLEGLDAPTMISMLRCVLKANDEVLAPFKGLIPKGVADGIEKVTKPRDSDAAGSDGASAPRHQD